MRSPTRWPGQHARCPPARHPGTGLHAPARGRRTDPVQLRLRRVRAGEHPGRGGRGRHGAGLRPAARRDHPQPARAPGADLLRRHTGHADLRQRHVHAAHDAVGGLPLAARDAPRGRFHRQRRVRLGGHPVRDGRGARRHPARPHRRPDGDRGRRADPGVHRPVPAGGPRASLEPGPARPERVGAGPCPGAHRHRTVADLGGGGAHRARAARRGRPGRGRDDRLRGRRPADHHPAARRRVPAVPGPAARPAAARSANWPRHRSARP